MLILGYWASDGFGVHERMLSASSDREYARLPLHALVKTKTRKIKSVVTVLCRGGGTGLAGPDHFFAR